MNILVIGSGGREHALAWAISGSPLADKVYCAPGNAGIAEDAECVPIAATDSAGLVDFCRRNRVDFVVVGPEAPLVAGLVDVLEAEGIAAFGPTTAAAALEGSKSFMKDLCAREGIPTAAYRRFRDADAAKAHIAAHGAPVVVKADGLAAGKGVVVASRSPRRTRRSRPRSARDGSARPAPRSSSRIFRGRGGELLRAGRRRDRLAARRGAGPQARLRRRYRPQYRRDGRLLACPCVTPSSKARSWSGSCCRRCGRWRATGAPFKGVLYAGLMLTDAGPKLLEYNVRFGDPECQALLMRLRSDLLPALLASRDGVLRDVDLRWYDETALCVVMAASGYPEDPLRGTEIRGLAAAASDPEIKIFHAGTRREGERLLADGGRVLGVTALGGDLAAARARAYAAIDRIDWPDGFCRRDIGTRHSRSGS